MKVIINYLALAAFTSFVAADPKVTKHAIHLSVVSATPTDVIPVVSVNPTQWFLSVSSHKKRGTEIVADSTVFAEGVMPTSDANLNDVATAAQSIPTSPSSSIDAPVTTDDGDANEPLTTTESLILTTPTGCLTCTSGPVPTFGGRGPTGDSKSLQASWSSKYLTSICGHMAPINFVSILGSSAYCSMFSHDVTATVTVPHEVKATSLHPLIPGPTALFPTHSIDMVSIRSAMESRKSAGNMWDPTTMAHSRLGEHPPANPFAGDMSMFSSLLAKLFPHATQPTKVPTTLKTFVTSAPNPEMHTMDSASITVSSVDLNCPGC